MTLSDLQAIITVLGVMLSAYLTYRTTTQTNALKHQAIDISATKLAVDTILKANADLEKRMAVQDRDLAILRSERERLNIEIGDFSRTNSDQSSRLRDMAAQITAMRQDIHKLNDERTELSAKVSHLSGRLEEQRVNHAEEVRRYTVFMDERVKSLENDLHAAKDALRESNARITVLQAALDEKSRAYEISLKDGANNANKQ